MTRVLPYGMMAALAANLVGVAAAPTQMDGSALRLFAQQVTAYAELHQRMDARFPQLASSDDLQTLAWRRMSLGMAIKAEREGARQGDIFEPLVAVRLREVIAATLFGVDLELMLADLYEDCEMPVGYRPQVNAEYPDWASHAMPPVLLEWLPALPAGIQYRLIDRDLLLWDVNADVIIDVLPDALPSIESSEE
jgi:hypothetical protein